MGYLLKEALKALCGVNQWCYAVCWKFGCQNPKLLIWEECYYERPLELPGLSRTHQITDLLVNKMMMDSHVIVSGERLVGRSALTGCHQWILSDDYYSKTHPPVVVKELCRQFSAGMQTIAVIPVLHYGVVQFGSVLKIMENPRFIDNVTSLVLQLGLVPSMLPSDDYAAKEQATRIGIPECLGTSISGYLGQGFPVDTQTSVPFIGEIENELPSHQNPQEIEIPLSGFSSLNQSVSKAEVIPSNSETLMDMIQCSGPKNFPDTGNQSQFVGADTSIGIPEFGVLMNDTEDTELGDDLFDVLGTDYKNRVFGTCWNIPSDPNRDNHILPCEKIRAWSEICSTSQGNSDSGIFSLSESDNLLEAVVSQGRHSCKTTFTSTSSSSTPNTSFPGDPSEDSGIIKGELFGVPKYPEQALRNVPFKEESGTYSQGSSVYGSQISSWIDQRKQNNSVSTGCSKKPNETGKPNRKRLKPGENPRPRPKDRQMIQDRVKELREIVPNGAKCSIDSLLERTIKHMLFLQSVMKHADKLKQSGDLSKNKDECLPSNDSFEGGVTWAYEVGTQSMVCPIRVVDLNQPGQMLVEMLCEDQGLFLEIADVIRGLGLTILKGIMETRNNRIWSRFSVESNRDVTRINIFMSLVHFLKQNTKPSFVQTNENLVDHQEVHMPGTSSNAH